MSETTVVTTVTVKSPDAWDDAQVFFWGLLWEFGSALEPIITVIIFSLIEYRDYGIDWRLIGVQAGIGALKIAGGYWKTHKNLLHPPNWVRERLAQAEQTTQNLNDARDTSASLRAVAVQVAQGDIPPMELATAVLNAPPPIVPTPVDTPRVFTSTIPPPGEPNP